MKVTGLRTLQFLVFSGFCPDGRPKFVQLSFELSSEAEKNLEIRNMLDERFSFKLFVVLCLFGLKLGEKNIIHGGSFMLQRIRAIT